MASPFKCVLLLLALVWSVVAQTQGNSSVSVRMDSTSVIYTLNGVDLGPTFLVDSVNYDNAGYFSQCGGYVLLNSTINSAATLLFNVTYKPFPLALIIMQKGTTISVNLFLANDAGDVFLYLDGILWQTVHSYSATAHNCAVQSVSSVGLSQQTHNITVMNGTPSKLTYVGGFNYTSFANVALASTMTLASGTHSSTAASTSGAASTSHHSNGPIVGGVVGGIVVLIALIFITIFMMKSRRRHSQDTIQPGKRGPAGLVMPGPEDPTPHHDISSTPHPYAVPLSPVSQSSKGRPPSDTFSKAGSPSSSSPAPTMSYASSAQPHPSFPRPLPDGPSPPYTSPVSTRAPSDSIIGRTTSDLTQVDLVQQLVSRGVPTHEVVRMMGEVSSSGSVGGPVDGIVIDDQPPPNYRDSKRG
ncbi:hypothetical protein FRB96_002725 [Tulasnella sp. 330]|nr:hypothetical protein FRB96_002725 [Tulasnella sp. 330]